MKEQFPVLYPTQAPSSQAATEKNGLPEMTQDHKLLVRFARKLHDSETAFAFLRSVFRMFQRIGLTVSPNHYYWPVPDVRELECPEMAHRDGAHWVRPCLRPAVGLPANRGSAV